MGKKSFRKSWGGFGKSQLGAWGRAQRLTRSDRRQYFDNAPAIDTRGGEKNASNRGIPSWGGDGDGAPIESSGVSLLEWNRLAKGRRLRRQRHHGVVVARWLWLWLWGVVFLLYEIHKVSSSIPANVCLANCTLASYLCNSLSTYLPTTMPCCRCLCNPIIPYCAF